MTVATRKYNPGFLSDEEIVASFCVRTSELESIIEMLRDCRGNSNPHQIVIGPRGSGKTSLLLRIAAEIRRDDSLSSSFFPVVFSEESYEVSTAGEFWLECLSRLAVQAPRTDGGTDLYRSYEELRGIADDQTLGERCLGAILDFSDRTDRRLVLFVENLNTLFDDMIDPTAGWQLRKVLQTEPRIVLIASATRRFDQIDNPDQALYDLFRVISLRPLDTSECATLWQTVSGREARPETIRSLHILTGGSPRLNMVVARFGASLSFRELMTELLDLIDDHTEYFRSHLEMLPPQERRVYLALADLWKPATAKEIAERARTTTSKCSAQLARLSERAVVEIAGGTARRKQYYLTERMYNIYYLLRRPRGPHRMVESLIRLMESFYSPHELTTIGLSIAREAPRLHGDVRALHEIALHQLLLLPALGQHRTELQATLQVDTLKIPRHGALRPAELKQESVIVKPSPQPTNSVPGGTDIPDETAGQELLDSGAALREELRFEEALSEFDTLLDRFGESTNPKLHALVAKALIRKGEIFYVMGRPKEALEACEEVDRRYGNDDASAVRENVAVALLNKAVALRTLSRIQDALATNDELALRFGESTNPDILGTVAKAFCDKVITLVNLSRLQEALRLSDEAVHRFGARVDTDSVVAVAKTLCSKGAILEKINRTDEALAVYDSVVRRYGASNETALLQIVAIALLNKAAAFGEDNRHKDALTTSEEVVRRFGTSDDPALLASVALAISNKGYALNALNRPEEALAAYDEVVRLYGDSQSPELREAVAKALLNKANALSASNRPECALSVYDKIATRFATVEPGPLSETVATALCNKGIILGKLGRHEQAIRIFDRAVDAFGTSDAPVLVEMVAKSLLNKGYALSALDRFTDTLAVFDEAESRTRGAERVSTQALAVHALVKKGLTLAELARPTDALPCYEEVIRRHESSGDAELRRLVAMAFLNKGTALAASNRGGEAVEAFDAVVQRYGANEPLPVLESVAKALVNKAGVLLTMARRQEAVYVCDEVIRRFGKQKSPVLAHMVADAFYVKGGALLEMQRPMESLTPFSEVLQRSSKAEPSSIPGLQAKALLGRGLAFDRLGKPEEALGVYDEVVAQFGEHSDPELLGPVASALARKVSILDGVGRQPDALDVHEDLVCRFGSAAPSYQELIERSLIERAEFHLISGRYRPAITAASLALARCLPDSLENRLRTLAIRAKARLADDDHNASEDDIGDILATLAELGTLPKELLSALMEFSVGVGYGRMRKLIEASPSATLLMALTTALAQEEGLQPRVAREVEEVAADIRKKLRSLKNGRAFEPTSDSNEGQIECTARTSGIVIRDEQNRTLPIRHGPIRLAVRGKGGLKSNSWKIWMEKNGEIYFSLREQSPGFKVSLHSSGKQHIKMANEYWGQWSEPEIYAGPTVATSAKLIVPAWGMREDADLTKEERERWRTNEIEIDAADEGKVLALTVIVRTRGQQVKQEGGKSETLAVWRRSDGKEAHLIVSEEAERNYRDIVRRALRDDTSRLLNDSIRDGKMDTNTVLTATLAGPANEGGNYFLCVSIKVQAQEGEDGKEYIPVVAGLEAEHMEDTTDPNAPSLPESAS